MGITDSVLSGFPESVSTLAAQAEGSGNTYLAGQYVQIACLIYTILSIPFVIFWTFYMEHVVLLFGQSERVADMALLLTYWFNGAYIITGCADVYGGLMDVAGHETFGAIFDIFVGALSSLGMFLLLKFGGSWEDLMYLWFFMDFASTAVFILMTNCFGWMDPYLKGMFCNLGLKNVVAVKNIARQGIPLSISSFLAYGQWEFLLILTAHLGPAEVAVWGMVGSVWEMLEAVTEGISEAAAIRVAYHLGKGRPLMAKISAHKCLYFSTLMGCVTTSILFIIGEALPAMLTKVPVIQNMIYNTIPLIGVSNIFLVFGMTAWGIIGGQNRNDLATKAMFVCSWFINIPLCCVFVYVYRLDLRGLVMALVVGYATIACVMSYYVLVSDWKAISNLIIKQTLEAANYGNESSSESSGSSASSSESFSESSRELASGDSSSSVTSSPNIPSSPKAQEKSISLQID
mmetsp:Transcript_34574/g.79937  ORF Transcript_34574/g.79937 Transcript_34574/m.79937 type:complete len:460 (-) Transcript_34574:135-1514(-)